MKILAVTDIHGAYDRVESILANEKNVSALIIGGDLTTNGSPDEARSALRRFAKASMPMYVVAGNMDPPDLEPIFASSANSINGRGVLHEDVGIFGVSGSPFTPMHTPYELSEDEIALRAHSGWKDVQAARLKIFVPHAPPHNTTTDLLRTGQHVGSSSIRKFIEQCRPQAVVCGHIHEARGIDVLGPTTIVNCGPAMSGCYAILTVGKAISVELKG